MAAVHAAACAPPEPPRHKLPDTRRSVTRHVESSWYERDEKGNPTEKRTSDLYVTASFYESGELAEVFASLDRAGSMVGDLVDSWCTALSIALQYGVPAPVLLRKFVGVGSGGPNSEGFATTDPAIPTCKGPVDYIARWLKMQLPDQGENHG